MNVLYSFLCAAAIIAIVSFIPLGVLWAERIQKMDMRLKIVLSITIVLCNLAFLLFIQKTVFLDGYGRSHYLTNLKIYSELLEESDDAEAIRNTEILKRNPMGFELRKTPKKDKK